jgi:chloride channel protein, CIC family
MPGGESAAVDAMKWFNRLERTTRLLLLSAFLGVVGALFGQAFTWMLRWSEALILTPISGHHFLTEGEAAHLAVAPSFSGWLWFVPVATTLGGLISGWLVYTFAPEAEGHGSDAVVKAYHRLEGVIRARIPAVKAVASAITIGSGGAAGREGPTAQAAAGLGSLVARLFGLPENERRYLALIGMAAGLSAIFKSPLGTAIFAVEILYSTMSFEAPALIYTIVASAIAYTLTGMFTGWTPVFALSKSVTFTHPDELVWYALLGVAAGALGALVPTIFYRLRDLFRSIPIPNQLKPAIGGLGLGLIGIFLPQLLGGGYGWMQLAINGKLALGLMLILAFGKILALSLTVSSGGSGGVFAPTLYVGTMFGASMAALVGMVWSSGPNPSAFAVVGMAALFAGAARVPIATLIMVAEMTGGYGLIMPTMLAVILSFVIQSALTRNAKYPTLYEAQVPRPSYSPAHRATYYRAVAGMLRRGDIRLEEDLMRQQLEDRLERGEAIPLASGRRGREYIYSVHMGKDSALAGVPLKDCHLPSGLIVASVLRDHDVILPHGDTALQAGDHLVIVASEEGYAQMREIAGRAGEDEAKQSEPPEDL